MSELSANSKTPAIRFKGFSGEWVESQLGQLIEITSASRVHKNDWNESGVPFFRTSDVVANFKGIENNKAYISFELYEELIAKSGKVKKNDILVTGGGSIGIPYLIESDKPIYFKDADLLWLKGSKNISGIYLYMFFLTSIFRKFVSSITHIGTISHYTIEQAKSTPITIPNKKEQTQIGNFFQQLDRLIAQHQQKHDKLLSVKKALLEKMFPKQGETQPAIRFKGFSEAWEEKALGEVVSSVSDGDWIESNHIFEQGKYRIIQTGNLSVNGEYIDKKNNAKYFHQKDFNEIRANEIFPGDILISRLAEPAGRTIILPNTGFRMVTAVDVTVIRPDNRFNSTFLKTQLNTAKVLLIVSENVSGTSHKRISRSNLEKTKLSVPNLEEQTKIGNLFQQLDSLINQQQSQVTKLGNIKQAMLAKMFV